MCGLCGEIRFDGGAPDAGALARMAETMRPRGPESGGQFVQGSVGMGHRRLRIIDLTPASQQPMVDSALGLSIAFNGAIYNYKELREELIALGYAFFSEGDTEVILKAYHAWGLDFVRRMHGMFAFALWERDSGRVVLGRDRLGIKPLYLNDDGKRLRFASTLPALLAGGGISGDIDPVALHKYMTFHAVVPAPRTILNDVRKLHPGSLLIVEPDGSRKEKSYWGLTFETRQEEAGYSEEDWRDQVLASLRTAIARRTVADVPVGVLLSGGLDSSLITALLAERNAGPLKTFSVGFETVGNEKGDEFQYSDIVAEIFGTEHEQIFVPTDRLLDTLPACVEAMSEPMVSHDAIGFYLLSQAVARHVKVVQSGQGADEVFGGYHWYPPLMEAGTGAADYARVFFDRDHDEFLEAVDPAHHGGDHSRAFVEEHFSRPGAPGAVEKALRLDTTVMLVDDPVKRVDNMTMAWSLEARVPFLDHELVELAARLPSRLKVRDGGKWILKEAGRQCLPAEVIDRPKGYFPVPGLKYIQGEVLDFVRGVLDRPEARTRGVFRRGYVDKLLADPEAHITPLRGSKLWQIALMEMWLQTHRV
jgi:asparagine synthase (glutamine-hydrolysing)